MVPWCPLLFISVFLVFQVLIALLVVAEAVELVYTAVKHSEYPLAWSLQPAVYLVTFVSTKYDVALTSEFEF